MAGDRATTPGTYTSGFPKNYTQLTVLEVERIQTVPTWPFPSSWKTNVGFYQAQVLKDPRPFIDRIP